MDGNPTNDCEVIENDSPEKVSSDNSRNPWLRSKYNELRNWFEYQWDLRFREHNAKAKRELDILMKTVEDPIIRHFIPEILKLVSAFNKSGQSGGSAPMTASALSQAVEHLCLQQPICDITGIDEEWNDITEINDGVTMFQNNRLSSIFKEGKDGKPYYLDAIVFEEQDGMTFHGNGVDMPDGSKIGSSHYIRLPFKPKSFYIDVLSTRWADKDEKKKDPKGDWWTHVVSKKGVVQLKEVFEYYDRMDKAS